MAPKFGANHVLFKDRSEAGILLADKLTAYCQKPVCIFGLARGGVITAAGVSRVLNIPFDVLVVKKLPSPYSKEFAIGAVAPDAVSVIHWKDAQRAGSDEVSIQHAVQALSVSIKSDSMRLRKGKSPIQVADKTVVLIDDGAATGATMEAAVLWAYKKRARSVIVALPVASNDVIARLKPEVDVVIVHTPVDHFESVGSYYQSFPQVSEAQVVQLIEGGMI